MNCPSCDHLNPEDATCCRHCKHPLQAEPAVRNQANSLNRLASRVFVGRKREMEELCTGLEDMLAGRGRLVLLAGEPGIGKTRLAEEFAVVTRQRGAQVLWGRCWEGEGAPAF